MGIGGQIRKLRKTAGLNTSQLADRVDVSQQTISNYETGKSEPGFETLERICGALGITLAQFFSNNEQSIPSDIRQILNRAKTLTPAQLKTLDAFLATISNPEKEKLPAVKEQIANRDLDQFTPLNEPDLGQALVELSEIAYTEGLTDEEFSLITKKLVAHYGAPTGGEWAAHGPKRPGRIGRKEDDDRD
jgi:transcriptional regulator with XRE-family HTH domain